MDYTIIVLKSSILLFSFYATNCLFSVKILFPLLPLQHCFNLLSTSSGKVRRDSSPKVRRQSIPTNCAYSKLNSSLFTKWVFSNLVH